MPHTRAFTRTDLAALLIIVVIGAAVLAAKGCFSLGPARNTTKMSINSFHVRGIQTGLVLYAQGNNKHYPGVLPDGVTVDPAVGLTAQGRVQILINQNYFTLEYARSPSETQTGTTSYALLQVNHSKDGKTITQGGRNDEWNATSNSKAAVISDRRVWVPGALGSWSPASWGRYKSVISIEDGLPGWQGAVGWNDGHVTFESRSNLSTKYGSTTFPADNLFTSPGDGQHGDDAMMVWTGTDQP